MITDSFDKIQNIADKFVAKATFLLTMTPTVGGMLCGLVQTWTDKTNKFHSVLAKRIVDTAEKLDLENNIHHFISTMTQIDRTFGRIVNNLSIHEDAELADIRRVLEIEIENFDRKIGVYKKYPTLSINSFFVLQIYVLAFDALFRQKKPHLAKFSQMTCDINRMLYEYRNLTVYNRLNLIDLSATYWFSEEKAKKIKAKLIPIVGSIPYSASGYNDANAKTIACTKMREIKGIPPIIMYIKDGDNSFYDNKDWNNIENCLIDYMKYARYQVERFFDKPLTLTNLVCSTKKESQLGIKGFAHLDTKNHIQLVQ
ncbi:uncharacterized protein LOC116344685 [Contarinia nasturtii]|uniref:uncharacterized protein LOC116344685 n=1 Tax=Contarinia nasturtii TaxID=265458 RepID=UPI0012D3D85A|nr:uncharacterized protein LOC116344685 [Contarinia nasturtii]